MVVVTDHALKRAHERCGISRKSVEAQAQRAFDEGLEGRDTNGSLRKFISYIQDDAGIRRESNGVNHYKIYGHYLWLFEHDRLVTVIEIPKMYVAQADTQRRRFMMEVNNA